MSERVDLTLIARYLSGECGAAESARVERWIAEDSENSATIESLRRVWDASAVRDVPEFDPDRALWRRIAGNMALTTKPRLVSTPPATPVQSRARFVALRRH